MEILIVLAIATVAVIGWFYGSLFVCVFLSLAAVLAGAASGSPDATLAILFAVGIIWSPRMWRWALQRKPS